jgi:hypothetical protein
MLLFIIIYQRARAYDQLLNSIDSNHKGAKKLYDPGALKWIAT